MNMMKTFVLLTGMTMMLLLAGQLIGGQQGMLMALIMAGLMNIGAFWFSDSIVLAAYGAREVTAEQAPEFYGMIRELAERGNLPMPRVYIIPSPSPNAFATGRSPSHAAVAATEGILQLLTREELMGVMAHELAHVKNRDTLISAVAATIAGAITYLAQMAQWAAMFGGGRDRDDEEGGGAGAIGMLLLMILGPIAAMLIQMAISRSREYDADRDGAAMCGNPLYLASALRKLAAGVERIPMRDAGMATAHLFIVNPLSAQGIASLFSTHPPMAERVQLLEEMAQGRR